MSKSPKPRKATLKKTSKHSEPETQPESQMSVGPVAANFGPGIDVTELQSQPQAMSSDDRPECANVKPYIGWISPPDDHPYNIEGKGEYGILTVSFTVERNDPIVPLGHIWWWDDPGGPLPSDDIPGDVQSWTATKTFAIPYTTKQDHILTMQAWNRCGPGFKFHHFPFTFIDKSAPDFEIVSPKNGATISPGTLVVQGWAEDRQSGVDSVEWSLDGGSYNAATFTPNPNDNRRVDWRFEIRNLISGTHTLEMRFRDKKGNQTSRNAASVITITAAAPYKPKDDLASLRAYLDDLLLFASTHVEISGVKLTEEQLADELAKVFYQPFNKLIDIRETLGNQPVNQLRAAIEVLRKYLVAAPTERPPSTMQLAAHAKFDEDRGDKATDAAPKSHTVTPQAPTLSSGQTGDRALALFSASAVTETDYRLAAYQALLSRIGTSYEEIRLARGADDDTRKALVSRLGITFDLGIKQLEKLYLSADMMTEANLELLFGLVDTTRDPLTNVAEPLLLGWRRDYLEGLWREQDEAEYSQPEAPLPIIDPDLINEDDLLLTKGGNPAFDLWQARTQSLANIFAALKQKRESQSDALKGFDIIVAETLGQPVDKLRELEEKQKTGTDIEPELKQLRLTRQAFTRLLRVRKMAENKTVTDAEWDDVYHILVQIKKQQSYDAWHTEEKQQKIALTPSLFQISETLPQLPPWRATWRARLNWLNTLQARIDQRQTTEDALRVAVSAVEEQTLPLLRDALIADLAGRWELSASLVADWLVHRLLVDLKTNASQRTTRLIQAIETVQGVLFALRAGQLAQNHPAVSWKLAVPEDHFDKEWQWMGNYSTWRAAMIIFFFPETVLLPSLREPYAANQLLNPLHRTKQFEALLKELRKRPRLTPDQARIEAGNYLNNLIQGEDQIPNFDPRLKAAIEATRPSLKEAPTFLTDQHTDETLGQRRQLCRDIVAPYDNQSIPNYIQEIFYGVPLQLAWQLQKSGGYLAALDWFQTVYAYNLPLSKRKIYYGLERETNVAPILSRSDHWLREELNPHTLAANRIGSNPHTRYTLMSLSRCLMDFADSEFTRDTAESLARARALYLTAQRVLSSPDLDTPTVTAPNATVLPNPLLDLLRLRVEIQLTKMRQGRNIAGMKRQVELPVSLPPGPSDLPVIGAGGQLIIPGTRPVLRPTPYYFRVLLERSKQLVNIAQQIEAAYLAALEKRDAESYNLLKANNDLQLAMEGVELQNRRVNEAQAGVGVAQAQRQRAVVMSERYKMLSSLGPNIFEQQMISSFQEAINYIRQAGVAGAGAAMLSGMAALSSASAAAASSFMPVGAGLSLTYVPNPVAASAHMQTGLLNMGSAIAQSAAAILSANAQVAQAQASIYGIQASAEWRQREFETQAAIAEQDVAIGEAQIGAAQAHVGVAEQERKIAQTQLTQAQAVADFLAKKFTNAELYEWMSGVLGEVYSYFLQQATAMAQLAENQLAFERQDTPPKLIRADYWEVPSDTGSLTTTDQNAPDRKGLTGSARLLRDIYQLDQYAFETDKRKLNLSQTFSLSRVAPYDFEQFRQTGVLTFATPTSFFDRDFPGHYLRLIKRVRLSVIALIPPHHGIRASLIASGISRVVTGGDVFQQVVVRRDPELVALTSPISATGVFELDTQSEMLLPFESMGVDTLWQFEMPRAANPFDFRTIADVLVTIDYTALNSFDYRQQVIKLLNPKLSGERSFIFRQQFADQWYDLHNPEQSATPMTVKFKTWREDFPPNLDEVRIEHILLFFNRVVDEFAEEKPFEVEVKSLRFTFINEEGKKVTVDCGGATTIDGVISTRRGNGESWKGMIGKTPAGEWELSFKFDDPVKDKEIRDRFKNEEIEDILLVITYGGRTPAWPA
ncbi:Ig-like domain-containing protein [candidate division KSB1 bacterium]|nr:Ig-like domain-containing protein [candidate division KSB1 bacterium]